MTAAVSSSNEVLRLEGSSPVTAVKIVTDRFTLILHRRPSGGWRLSWPGNQRGSERLRSVGDPTTVMDSVVGQPLRLVAKGRERSDLGIVQSFEVL